MSTEDKVVVLLDTVYMLVGTLSGRDDVVYCAPGKTAAECWDNYSNTRVAGTENYLLGTGCDVAYMKKRGYRAKKVQITQVRNI